MSFLFLRKKVIQIFQCQEKLIGRELKRALTVKQIEAEANETRNSRIKCVADREETHNNFSNKAVMIRKPNWPNMIMVGGCSFQLQSIPEARVKQL